MPLRIKVLALLGAIALVPALLTASLDVQRLRSLSADLTTRNADAMADQALITMQRIAAEYANVLDLETRRIRVLVELQADYAQRLLSDPQPPSDTQADTFFSDDFDAGEKRLALTTNPAPLRYSESGAGSPLAVSWSTQVFHHPPALQREGLLASAAALLPMQNFYEKVRDRRDRVLRWQYIVLDNGLSATYPGHGNYPPDYDPRERPWYEAQRSGPGYRWYRPHVDAATGALVINASMPLFDSAGAFIGITAIDVDLTATFEALRLPPYLRDGAELMQVAVMRPPRAREAKVLVLARQHAELNARGWRTLPDLETFSLGGRATTKLLREAMFADNNGHLRAQIEGRDSFILYHRFGQESAYIVMTVPVDTATRAALDAGNYAAAATRSHVSTLLMFLAAASTLVIIVALVSSRHLTRPIEHLMTAVERLAGGDFHARAELKTGDELQTLGEAFDAMVPQLKEHARVGEALLLAKEIQQQLLPDSAPELAGYDVGGISVYSDLTGGDYFDYVLLESPDGDRYGIVVADVAGHGIGASLLMATTRALLHGARDRGLSIGELLGFVNKRLAEDISGGHFVTLFLLAVEAASGRLEWACAGHDAALHFSAGTGVIDELTGNDIPLGIDADWQFGTHHGVELAAGDIVMIGTDGIWEAHGENGERFGKQRVRDYIAAHAHADAETLCAGLRSAIERFRGGRVPNDDVTIVVVKRAQPA